MNVLLAASRGGGLEEHMKDGIKLKPHIFSGGSFSLLTSKVTETLPPPYIQTSAPTHIYIMAGIPDITKKTAQKATRQIHSG